VKGKYQKRFIVGMLGYLILLPVSLLLLRSEPFAGRETLLTAVAAVFIALMPVLPFIYVITAVIGNVRQQDELHQRMNLEAVLITALLTGGLTFSYSLLEASGLVPKLPLTVIAPSMVLIWGAANSYVSRRYG
jgi:hypothetical protein